MKSRHVLVECRAWELILSSLHYVVLSRRLHKESVIGAGLDFILEASSIKLDSVLLLLAVEHRLC